MLPSAKLADRKRLSGYTSLGGEGKEEIEQATV